MPFDKFYIDGAWVDPAGKDTIDVINPATEEVIATLPAGTPEDVDRAVAAAKRAFTTWSQTTTEERAVYLDRIAAAIKDRSEEIGEVVSREMGMPLKRSVAIQIGMPQRTFASYAKIAREYEFESGDGATRSATVTRNITPSPPNR